MVRRGVTQQESDQACVALSAAGKPVTVEAVLQYLGRGSKTTLVPFVREWKAQHPKGVADAASAIGLPGDVVEVVRLLQDRLQGAADAKVTEAQERYEQGLAELDQRLAAEIASGRQVRVENAALREELTQLRAALAHEQTERQHGAVAKAALEAERASLQERLRQRDADVAALHEQLKEARAQYIALDQATRSQREQDRLAADARLYEAQAELVQLRNKLAEHQQALAVVRAEHAHAETQLEQHILALAGLRAEVAQTSADLTAATAALSLAQEQVNSHRLSAELYQLRMVNLERELVREAEERTTLKVALAMQRGELTALLPIPAPM